MSDDAELGEKEADRVLAATVEELGGQQIWAGIIPAGLHGRLVVKSGMAEDKASKLLTKLAKTARLAACRTWSARCNWVNATGTNAETRMMWRTAVRRVAQNNHMAVGSLAGIRAMTTKQFAAWRRKLIRHIAGEEILAKNRERWEGILNAETDREFELKGRKWEVQHGGGPYNTQRKNGPETTEDGGTSGRRCL